MKHPLYSDPALVDRVTRAHLAAGRTILQLWLAGDGSEAEHARAMLVLASPPPKAHVLSLGCGVAGMEALWHAQRPDLTFTLVNLSQEQLDLCLCPGERICADAQTYRGATQADLTVLAYVLGHVNPLRTLRAAVETTRSGGRVMVIDLFNAPPSFADVLAYHPPAYWTMRESGFRVAPEGGQPSLRWRTSPALEGEPPHVREAVLACTPMVWVRDV